ncbi:uncharacterized protein LOC114391537 [Glycine soja]|uniref:uncharacterized protein LOC114391537 n=1 Tax=Glycine soja TaxID=3848 RepID=UPI00103CCB3F|nr:uncharacterized protein LOC114391537 [Glycine soja]
MSMDRSWITAPRISEAYQHGVEEFLSFAEIHSATTDGNFFCPFVKCVNGRRHSLDDIRSHMICDGFSPTYTKWIWHGELVGHTATCPPHPVELQSGDLMEDMICDLGQEGFRECHADIYDALQTDAHMPLYVGCKSFTRLSAVLALVNLKARFGWSDKSFTELVLLLKNMFPEHNSLPKSHYEAKKILCPVGLEYQRIHACPNDCLLYRNEFLDMRFCPTCGLSRYKANDGEGTEGSATASSRPTKVCWYLPIIPRLKRLFASEQDSKYLRWHIDERRMDGMIRHPADCTQWKTFDSLYPSFAQEPRNLRLALASDGMNPFGNLTTNHSSWPVLLMIYNFPPWLSMKRKYMLLSMMIAGPKQPGNDIDVYLAPLIEDLTKLWVDGVEVYDANAKRSFNLRAMLFCTINDFPAYGNLSGYSVKGHHACPICEKNTCYIQLTHRKKTVYTRHRRFLSRNHPYRRLKKAFNGDNKVEIAPEPLSAHDVYQRVRDIETTFGKTQKKDMSAKNIWKKGQYSSISHIGAIWIKVIDPSQLDILENEAAIIVCELEMLCGPVYLRWMYPVERFMKVLKGYTKNQYRPEASIVERYVAEEAIEFSSNYITNAQPVGVPQNRHQPSSQGRGTRGFDVVTMNLQRLSQAQLYVLNNTAEVMSYLHSHKNQLSAKNPRMNKMRLLQEHNRTFVNWFKQCIFADATASETLRLLALGPNLNVPTWQGYDINGYAFYTKSQDERSTMQNSGVSVEGEAAHFSSVSDNNPINASMSYYGVIEDIWELDYGQFRVPVFSCRWVHANTGVRKDKTGFTLVDLKKGGYNDEPFIMAVQARQVFYVEDPSDPTWSVVIQGRKFDMTDYSHYAPFDVTDMPPVNDQIPVIEATDEDDVEHAMRHDHHEGLWENNDT